jgi:pimeloyl-ACP methyl ester carboxylesterase
MQTQYFTREGGRLAYSDYGGGGELVLMLPGMGALRSEYRFLAPQLSAEGYRAVTVDLRGHGESSVPWPAYDVPSVGGDILAIIDHLDGGAAHLIGTSFSPAALVWAAAARSSPLAGPSILSRDAKINPPMKSLFWLTLHNHGCALGQCTTA